MVTIKIQSVDDIILAYLEDLGFDRKQAQKATPAIKKLLPADCGSGDEIIRRLDQKLIENARIIFSGSPLGDPQIRALLRLTYIRAQGADKWGAAVLTESRFGEEMLRELHKQIVESAPNYVLSQMKPQPIEPAHLFHKIFHPSKKSRKK